MSNLINLENFAIYTKSFYQPFYLLLLLWCRVENRLSKKYCLKSFIFLWISGNDVSEDNVENIAKNNLNTSKLIFYKKRVK